MPVFSTLGSLAEFKQGYTTPLTPISANIVPCNPGIGGIITVVPNNSVYTGTPVTFVANSNIGNYTFNTIYPSNTILAAPIEPFTNYTFNVRSFSAGGYSNNYVTTNALNLVLNVNLKSNVNIANNTITDALDMAITPDGTKLTVLQSNRYVTYNRNPSTGNLTPRIIRNANVISGQRFDGIISSNDVLYIQGIDTNFNARIWQISHNSNLLIGNLYFPQNYDSRIYFKPQITGQGSGNQMYVMVNDALFNANKIVITYDIQSNGVIGSEICRSNLANTSFNLYQPFNPTHFVTTKDGIGYHALLQQIGGNNKVILNYANANSNTTAPTSVTSFTGFVYTGLTTVENGTSIYTTDNATLSVYSRNVNNSALTLSSNISINMNQGVTAPLNNVYLGGNNILLSRNTSNGYLTTISGYTSFNYPDPGTKYVALMTNDANNIYVLNNTSINIFGTKST